MFTKFQGVTSADLDGVVLSLTDAEFEELEQGWIDLISQLTLDEFTLPLGLPLDVDGSLLYCRLYRMSLDKMPEDLR